MGGAITVRDAVLLVAPAPLSLELIGPVVLFCMPPAMPVTFTKNAQLPPPARNPPEKLMMLVPAVAVTDPVQFVLNPLGVDITNPAGSVSLNEMPVVPNVFGLVTTKPKLVLPFNRIVAAPNDLITAGAGGFTTILADAGKSGCELSAVTEAVSV